MRKLSSLIFVTLAITCFASGVNSQDVLVEYLFQSGTNDTSGHGLHGELLGDAIVADGRLATPGDRDSTMSIPLGQFSPFDGLTNWSLSSEFQTVNGSTGSLFSADGSAPAEPWPDNPDTGDQTGSLNIFLNEEGQVATDFWYIDVVESVDIYNDDDVTVVGSLAGGGELGDVDLVYFRDQRRPP